MIPPPTVRIRRLRPSPTSPPLPRYQTAQAAGMDLHADLDGGERVLPPLGRMAVPTGLALELPPGFEGQVRPRSGLALKHGVTVLNAPGTVDADYRGEVQVLLVNLGEAPVTVRHGDRVAQLVVARVEQVEVVEAHVLGESGRGAGGFGSTGG